jgi:integrase
LLPREFESHPFRQFSIRRRPPTFVVVLQSSENLGILSRTRLSALAVTRASRPGLYADGAGLYLRVNRNGSKSWAFRFMIQGKPREMGLGSLTKVTLADARRKAADARLALSNGRDPLALRREQEAERAAEEKIAQNSAVTFNKCAEGYIAAHEASWKNEKHKQQWRNTIATYVSPVFGNTPVQDVDLDLILKAVEPIWSKKAETARRIRGRIEVILDWARVRGYRSGENPARWRGQMDQLLPARSKAAPVKHHAALPYSEVSEFMKELRVGSGSSAAALEFLILTAARTSEVVYARWTEIDLKRKLWIVPAARMKSGREHRVPLDTFLRGMFSTVSARRLIVQVPINPLHHSVQLPLQVSVSRIPFRHARILLTQHVGDGVLVKAKLAHERAAGVAQAMNG